MSDAFVSWTFPPFCIAKVPIVTHCSDSQSWFTRIFHGDALPPGLIVYTTSVAVAPDAGMWIFTL
jgi:hypothetical protein